MEKFCQKLLIINIIRYSIIILGTKTCLIRQEVSWHLASALNNFDTILFGIWRQTGVNRRKIDLIKFVQSQTISFIFVVKLHEIFIQIVVQILEIFGPELATSFFGEIALKNKIGTHREGLDDS